LEISFLIFLILLYQKFFEKSKKERNAVSSLYSSQQARPLVAEGLAARSFRMSIKYKSGFSFFHFILEVEKIGDIITNIKGFILIDFDENNTFPYKNITDFEITKPSGI